MRLPRSLDAEPLLNLTGAYALVAILSDQSGHSQQLAAAVAQAAHHGAVLAFGLISLGLMATTLRQRAS